MRTALKQLVPAALIAWRRRWIEAVTIRRFRRQWESIRSSAFPASEIAPAVPRSILIFPSDPESVTGAVGDDAMITATIDHFRDKNSDIRVAVLCRAGAAEEIVRSKGFDPVTIPDFVNFPNEIALILGRGDYDVLAALGADVMDGYYDGKYSAQILVAADLAVRSGMQALVLGFSFNARAVPWLSYFFEQIDARVALNLRDDISLDRFNRFAPKAAGRLVSDSAFRLNPGHVDEETSHWIRDQKAEGRLVVGLNMHPMLVRSAGTEKIAYMAKKLAEAVFHASKDQHIAWLLVPHDYRDDSGDGDGIFLRPLYQSLAAKPELHIRYFEGEHRAATLKALAGLLDGVFTGRMHLAIAALGMGVPVMCLTYQDKFEGLFRHFDLPEKGLLSPVMMDSSSELSSALKWFLVNLPVLKARVAANRERIISLADRNFVPTNAMDT